uniref:Protein-S-isoprenylcysteine O-methyltransferase n=1 Tax=Evadne anonyx TaxID=141404 RepID=A0A9N6WQG1_9CRUS|nr:EOG090X0CFU [Evadne anonyx]
MHSWGKIEGINPLCLLVISTLSAFVICCAISQKSVDIITFEVLWRSHLLGVLLAFGLSLNIYYIKDFISLGWYIMIMSFFHFSEFLVTSIIRPQTLSTDSFLLNHSKAYTLAALVSWFEYLVQFCCFPMMKRFSWFSFLGLVLCIGGEALRKIAMLTAGSNFDHLIRTQREEKHQLVTSGIYRFFRHPSYVGWFYWSIGTQIILCNPFCIIAYTLASWKFFHERVYEEEITLLQFFGDQYVAYQKKVSTGLPFIRGYSLT